MPSALKPPIIPHSAWQAQPPVGLVADAMRRNIAPGDTLRFKDFLISLLEMSASARRNKTSADTAHLVLQREGTREEILVPEGAAFNWNGLHLAVLALHAREDELGGGLAELEVAAVEALPARVAEADSAGGAAYRLRIPHEVQKVTLHHSGSPEPLTPEDDPIQKLRALQAWGARARNWWDVPYHFLIDLEGRIYEGRDYRYMGETNTGYNPRGHLLISVLGNYNLQKPTPEQIESIIELMTWATAKFNVSTDQIYGHYEWANTSCPGKHLRKYLEDGTFQKGVRVRLQKAYMQ